MRMFLFLFCFCFFVFLLFVFCFCFFFQKSVDNFEIAHKTCYLLVRGVMFRLKHLKIILCCDDWVYGPIICIMVTHL